MATTTGGSLDGARSTPGSRAATRFLMSLRAKLGWQRIAFTLAACTLVSTQVLFQPNLYRPFLFEYIARSWLDYLGECLLMGFSIMLAATCAEVLHEGRRRRAAFLLVPGAIGAGALVGSLLVIPYYDLSLDDVFVRRLTADFAYWVAIGGGIVLIYALQQRAAAAAAALEQARVDRVALAKQQLEARLQVMRAQIEPHFLFNTLANVKRLCQTDAAGGVTMLENLGRYLRAALPRMRETDTTLAQEADLVRAYLAVLQVRMGARLRFTVDIPADLRHQPFPPMMLLTLVENAVKHGLNPSPSGGAIAVRAALDGSTLVVTIADSGVGFGGAATAGTGVGLANTRARLGALYGERGTLELSANQPSGVTASIRLPITPRSAPAFPPA